MTTEFQAHRVSGAPHGTHCEGPHWDSQEQALYWVDIVEKRVFRRNEPAGTVESFSVPRPVSCVVTCEHGGLVLGLDDGIAYSIFGSEGLNYLSYPEPHKPNNRMNDGKCDGAGRFWIGSMPLDGSVPEGSLYRLGTDGYLEKMLTGIAVSNGPAWSRGIMYHVDSPTRTIDGYDFDLEEGGVAVTTRRPVATLPADLGVPDGLTTDREGNIWVAMWGGSCVVCLDPQCVVRARVVVPARKVSSCCFGGKKLDRLYITAGTDETSEGGLFVAEPGVSGEAGARYRGPITQ